MPDEGPRSITRLLDQVGHGDHAALLELWDRVAGSLRDIADGKLRRERDARAMESTVLVHEAFIRLFGKRQVPFKNRKHFYCFAAKIMVHLLIDDANRRKSHLGLSRIPDVFNMPSGKFVALKECVELLEKINARVADVVRMRFFGQLTVEQTADYLEIAPRTVDNDFQFARAWLRRCLRKGDTA